MTYLFFGSDSERIKMYLKNFLNKFFSDSEHNVINFNAQDSLVDDALNELNQLSLSFNKKVVVIDNATYLENKTKYSKSKDARIIKKNDYSNIVRYIKQDNDENILLIFIVYKNEINLENEIVNSINKENRKLLKPLLDEEWPQYVEKYFLKKGFEIDKEAINEIIDRIDKNLNTFIKESEKLVLYCDNKVVTKDDVNLVFSSKKNNDILALSSALIANKKEEALKIYRDLRDLQNIEPVQLIALLTSSLIFLDEVNYLKSLKYTNEEIAVKLKVSTGRIYYATNDLKKVDIDNIKKALHDLYNLDKAIKHNTVDRFYSFEMFILNF